jgi:hypothetical protein
MVFGGIIGLLALIALIWVIYDVLVNQKRMSTGLKIVWIIFAIIFNILTAIVYYFVVKRK